MSATIIDFSPQALEIDQVAQAAGLVKPNIPPPPLFTANDADKNFILAAGQQFISSAPDILFVAEYAEPNQPAHGVLLVFEDYYSATHYEIFKRNYTAQDDSWQRILICDSTHLKTETQQFASYIQNRLQFNLPMPYYAILDTDIQPDQIAEYKVAAGNYPTNAGVNFELILQSQGALSQVTINDSDTVFGAALRIWGVPHYAWLISLCNANVKFFGKESATIGLSEAVGGNKIWIPKDLSIIPKAINESIYYFGLAATLNNIFYFTREFDEINNFYYYVLQSINTSKNTLSYNTLQNYLKKAYPDYADYITRLGNGTVSNPAIVIPNYADETTFNNLSNLTFMMLRLNSILVAALYAQDNDARVRLAAAMAQLQASVAATLQQQVQAAHDANILSSISSAVASTAKKQVTQANLVQSLQNVLKRI